MSIFLPTFVAKNGLLPTFILGFWVLEVEKIAFCPKKVGNCPLLKSKVGRDFWQIYS